jgi:hypothetical protein
VKILAQKVRIKSNVHKGKNVSAQPRSIFTTEHTEVTDKSLFCSVFPVFPVVDLNSYGKNFALWGALGFGLSELGRNSDE